MSSDTFGQTLHEWLKVSTHRSMRHFIHYARQNNLSMSHIGALIHLHHVGKSGVTELGNHLDVTSAAASQMLERLAQQEFILRSEDPDDRRVKQIVLTEKGKRVIEDVMRARQSWLDDLNETLTDAERKRIKVALEILIDRTKILKQPLETHR